eukprot:Mrub_01642.p2 GENE.Mrub_01642~~Mrub_01642.p2  ORF type:complete len:210 (+),score=-17.85 Mrub_01642:1367-1996(+)
MRVRIPHAVSLRFPGEGKSAQGYPGPKARPKGVVDGYQVNIPAHLLRSKHSADRQAYQGCYMPRPSGRWYGRRFLEKLCGQYRSRTKTDTGRRGEYPQALERMVVKELGKLTPYVRDKEALRGAEKRPWQLFIKNTALCYLARGCIQCDACPMPECHGSGLSSEKLTTYARVNGGRNYDGPKVAKFLVGYVPTRMNSVMTGALSPRPTR